MSSITKTYSQRYGLFPIRDELSWEYYKILDKATWTAEEIAYDSDKNDYRGLSKEHKNLIDPVLAFLYVTDGLVIDNIMLGFIKEAETLEEQYYFIKQCENEVVHSVTYSKLIDTLCLPEDKEKLINLADNTDAVKMKCDWFDNLMNSDLTRQERFFISACAEGIFFMSSFYIIFWFKTQNKLSSVIFANELIGRDETTHRDYAIEKINDLKKFGKTLDLTWARKILMEAVELELNFAKFVFSNPTYDLLYDDVEFYVKLLAEVILEGCGLDKIWNVPLSVIPSWMLSISSENKTNFYESRVGSYRTKSTTESLNDIIDDFDDIDF